MLVKSKLMRRGLFKTRHKMNTNNTRTYYVLLYDDTLFRTLNAFDEHPKYHRPKQHFEETSKKKKKKTRASVLLFPKSLCLRLSLRRRRRGPPTTKERNRQRRPLSRRVFPFTCSTRSGTPTMSRRGWRVPRRCHRLPVRMGLPIRSISPADV